MMPGAASGAQTAPIGGGVALGGRGVFPWRVLLALAALSLALGTALYESLAGRSATRLALALPVWLLEPVGYRPGMQDGATAQR
jgi:hypothetical protein